jgi:membrane protein implicated in regulation of membrane protease activity
LRPIALREIAKRTPKNATNTEALLGVSALTRSEITEYSGEVDLRGEVWSARSVTGTIPAQHRVTVSKIDGAIAVVESAPSPPSAH